ncbi:MAG: HlyD family efflux transporter periplasmic adaptor subunit [Gammaproteobacteria bacterium]|nr:HlyD family efflux transporter periplasmic adaptor subunit [Gammaproteobacteria bacterium]
MNRSRTIGLIALAIALLVALAWGFRPRPVPVEVAAVERGPLRIMVEEEGQTRVKDRYVISAPVAGYLQRIELDVGDNVSEGQTLALLEPLRPEVLDPRSQARAEAQVAAAEAALKGADEAVTAARAEARYARSEYTRTQKLRADALISQDALEQAENHNRQASAALRSAEFAVDVARFELEAARTSLSYSLTENGETGLPAVKLRAPVDSRVLRIDHESEGVVSTAQDLLEIGDPAALEVAVDVLSADAVRIQPESRVIFRRWGGDQTLEGVVRTIEPVGFTKISALGVEEQRVWVIADLTSPRDMWLTLGDGYRVEANFILWEAGDVLQLPANALFRHADGWAVFSVENGRARRREIETGQRNGLVAEVLAGLDAGARVILHPDDRIEDGIRVEVQQPGQ